MQRHVPKHIHKLLHTSTSSSNMSRLGTNPTFGVLMIQLVLAKDQQWSFTRQHTRDKVQRNVFAVKAIVNQLANTGHDIIFRVIILQIGNMRKGKTSENHAITILPLAVKVIHRRFSDFIHSPASSKSTCETMHTRATPLLESIFQIASGVVVPVIVREEDALCSVEGIGEEFLVQAVLLGAAVAHEDAVLAHVVWGWCLVNLVPDDDDFVEGGDFVFGEVKEGFVELGGALVGLDGDAASHQYISFKVRVGDAAYVN